MAVSEDWGGVGEWYEDRKSGGGGGVPSWVKPTAIGLGVGGPLGAMAGYGWHEASAGADDQANVWRQRQAELEKALGGYRESGDAAATQARKAMEADVQRRYEGSSRGVMRNAARRGLVHSGHVQAMQEGLEGQRQRGMVGAGVAGEGIRRQYMQDAVRSILAQHKMGMEYEQFAQMPTWQQQAFMQMLIASLGAGGEIGGAFAGRAG